MAASRLRVLTAYRNLLRVRAIVFANDAPALQKTAQAIRDSFRSNLDASPDNVPALLKEADEAVDFLKQNVIQAEYNPETKNYTQKLRPEHATKEDIVPQGAVPLEPKK
ncbi:hypothetical protein AAMO2058_001229000 [Amorphochlora amoebiformis]